MLSREILLSLVLSFSLVTTAFAEESKSVSISGTEGVDPMTLASAENASEAPIALGADESITIRTTTTTYSKPAFGGVYTDCFPQLCPMEASEDSEIPPVNWIGVNSCCDGGQCFWVDGNGRTAMTDRFFRCVAANTPQTALVQTTSEMAESAAAAKKPARKAKPSPSKRKS